MSILAGLTAFWGGVCSPTGQAIIGLANLGGTTYTAVKASQNSNKLSSLQSSVYGIATELKDVKAQTSDLFTIDDMRELISGGMPSGSGIPTTTTTTTTTTPLPASSSAPTPTAPTALAEPAQDNMPPAWAQQLIQQQLQQAEVIKTLMQQNTASAVPANTTVNVNPTAPATVPGSVPAAIVPPAIDATAPASAAVDPGMMAFLQQQANAINELASAVTALKTSIGEIEAVIDASDSEPTPPTPPVGGWNDEDEDIEDLIEKSDSHYPASSKKRRKKKKHKKR